MRFQNTPYWGHFRKAPFSSPFYFTCYCGWYADTHRKVNFFFLLFPLSFPLNIVHVAIFSDVLTKTTETLHTWINQSYSLVEANSRLIGSAGSFLEYISFFRSYWSEFYLKRAEGRKGCTVTLSQTTNNVNSFSLAERILALGSSVIVSMTKMIGSLAKLWPLMKGFLYWAEPSSWMISKSTSEREEKFIATEQSFKCYVARDSIMREAIIHRKNWTQGCQ